MKTINQILSIILALVGMNVVADAATITVTPSFDKGIRSDQATSATGTSIQLGNLANSSNGFYGMVQFDLGAIPEGSVIQSVTLSLWYVSPDGQTPDMNVTVQVHQILRPFTSELTWTQYDTGKNWGTAGGTGYQDRGALLSTVEVNTKVAAGTKMTLGNTVNFVDAVSDAVEGDGLLYLALSLSDVGIEFNRRIFTIYSADATGGNASRRPSLTIEYSAVPEPSMLSFVLSGGIFVGAFLRRHRRRD